MRRDSIYAVHRNDILYKTHEHILKEFAKKLTEHFAYDHEPLQYLLIDGEFHGACVGHSRNGPCDLNHIVCDLENAKGRRQEIIEAVSAAQRTAGCAPTRKQTMRGPAFAGKCLR